MPRKPKTTLDLPKTNSTPTQRQFTDREMPQQIFTDALATVNQQNYSILTFYGVGGIGKTRLQEHLQQAHLDQDENSLYSKVNFQNPDNRQPYRALRTLVKNFTGEPKIAFNAFGLAYMQYWEKAFPDQDIKKEGLPFLEEGSLLATAADVVDEVGGVASLAVGALDYLYRKVKERNFDEAIYNRLKALESKTADDIEDSLPLFFAYDIERYKIKHPEKKIVIFLDTYEALWTDKRSEANEFSEDQWLRDGLVTELQQVLFVICGREKLIWDKEDNAWQSDLNQHLIGNLSDLDAGKFLSSCQIINPELQQRIIADSEGVPFYLDLCVDTFERIQQHRTPTADDFARVGKAELFERFMRYLDRSETETLKMLAFPRFYTADIFSLLVREFETGYPASAMAQLNAFSFISEDKGQYQLHNLMQKSLQQKAQAHQQRAHQLLFEYYNQQLEIIDIKHISEAQQQAFSEACYHAMQSDDIEASLVWFYKLYDQFYQAAHYRLLLESTQQFTRIVKTRLGEEHIKMGNILNRLAYLHDAMANYTEAEPLYQRSLSIREAVLGKEHPDVAQSLNNLAVLYKSQGKYGEAEPLYQRSLSIWEAVLGKEHPNVALSLNNLAMLYYAQGKVDEAEPLYQQAIAIMEKALGSDHPNTQTVRANLEFLQQQIKG